ncbi:MAG: cysteine--tRNA ligase, partial [Phycisphaerales bacterium]|nr:cysteine--tRNA ligase [Phycisphaerales bacterium]
MTLRVYNTLTSEKELFESVKPGEVGVYLCGPTVYKPSHIGHAVGPVIFDVIKRYLMFKNFKVTWVVNVTDVEDKLIAEAEAQGRDMLELARDLER